MSLVSVSSHRIEIYVGSAFLEQICTGCFLYVFFYFTFIFAAAAAFSSHPSSPPVVPFLPLLLRPSSSKQQ